MDAESTVAALVINAHASLAGSGAGSREPPHAVDSSVVIVTTIDGSKRGGRTRTKPDNSSMTSAAGALTLQLLELRSHGGHIAVECRLVARAQTKISPIRRDGRFTITNRCCESTLFAQVCCGERPIDRVVGERPPLRRIVCLSCVAGALPESTRYEIP